MESKTVEDKEGEILSMINKFVEDYKTINLLLNDSIRNLHGHIRDLREDVDSLRVDVDKLIENQKGASK